MATTAATAYTHRPGDTEDLGHEHDAFSPLLARELNLADDCVFHLLQRVRSEILSVIDTTLSYDQLKQPTFNFSVVRPLTLKLSRGERPPAGLIYALLVSRVHFLDVASDDLAFAGVNTTRADLCELLAIKLLSAYGSAPQSLELLNILTLPLNPFCGATKESFAPHEGVDDAELEKLLEWGRSEQSNALEVGIFSHAKRFVRSPLVQQVIKAIYTGEVIYTPQSAHSFIRDDYKTAAVIEVYDWRKEPFLDHKRLRVPRIRNRLEFLTFTSILVLFLVTQLTHEENRFKIWEMLFILYGLGFSLDEYAAIAENSLGIYATGAYNVMDALFCLDFFVYLALRISGWLSGDQQQSELAFDTLSLAASIAEKGCILFPRLTISLMRGNVVLLALSAMIKEFCVFMLLVSIACSGFLATFYILARGTWTTGRISWLMLKMYLGSSFLGFEKAEQFHPIFGPALMVIFSILTQTLLITILISILSNTFAALLESADTEVLHQNSLRTIERVKSDALTSYMPPLNLVALAVLLPVRWLSTPRWTHKTHVFLTKTLNFPVLLFLALDIRARHQRGYLSSTVARTKRVLDSLPRGLAFDGTVDNVAKIFERETTAAALAVPSIDDPAPNDDAQQAADDADPKSPITRVRGLGLVRSKTYGPGGASAQHARMGSLSSPLGRIFNVDGAQGASKGSASGTEKESAEASKGVEARLAAIEAALAILVGEVVKSSEPDAEKRLPSTSLTGDIEPSYTDKD